MSIIFLCTVLDRFFQTSTASSDTSTPHLDHQQHGLIVSSTAAITCTSDLASTISHHHTVDHQQHQQQHQIDKHGNLLISPKSEVL
jgi:hypothetical protein